MNVYIWTSEELKNDYIGLWEITYSQTNTTANTFTNISQNGYKVKKVVLSAYIYTSGSSSSDAWVSIGIADKNPQSKRIAVFIYVWNQSTVETQMYNGSSYDLLTYQRNLSYATTRTLFTYTITQDSISWTYWNTTYTPTLNSSQKSIITSILNSSDICFKWRYDNIARSDNYTCTVEYEPA